jgi:acetyl esterase/lipase
MTPLAHDLALRGYAAWNIEYRRVGQEGGGWPGTFEDAASAVDALRGQEEIDASRVVTVGHSAGGHLALWLAGRHRLPQGTPGSDPSVRPMAAVSLAGIADLVSAAEAKLGDGAVQAFLGGEPQHLPERYAVASPVALTPLGVSQVLVHGRDDDIVPPAQSEGYAARAGEEAELVLFDGDHFDVIDPGHLAWQAVIERLPRLLA